MNLEFELRARGVRDRAEITWITNEYELGDFGMAGMHLKRASGPTRTASMAELGAACVASAGANPLREARQRR